MSTVSFSKWHGLGNDFVIIDARQQTVAINRRLCQRLADRRRGIGCDQLLIIEHAQPSSLLAAYRIFNTDGSSAEQCGNGARCVGRYLAGQSGQTAFSMASPAGAVEVLVGAEQVTVSLPPPRQLEVISLALAGQIFTAARVDLGNPHAVIEVPDVDAVDLDLLGREAQRSEPFKDGVNLGVFQSLTPTRIKLRVYERGVGETPACGSGACAAALAAGGCGPALASTCVDLPGGTLVIDWAGEGHALIMSGAAEHVFDGTVEI